MAIAVSPEARLTAPALSVLIADDEAAVRTLVKLSIASETYHLVEAVDGDDAWNLIQALHPALVVLDNKMPGLSGLAVCTRVRADPALAGMRILMLTANGQQTDVDAGFAAGVDAYLTKPFSPIKLMLKVEELLWGALPDFPDEAP